MKKINLNQSILFIQYNITIIIFLNHENLQLKKGPSTNSKKCERSGYRSYNRICKIKDRVNTLKYNNKKIRLFLFEENFFGKRDT